jgi:hypothetical protein
VSKLNVKCKTDVNKRKRFKNIKWFYWNMFKYSLYGLFSFYYTAHKFI